MKPIDQTLFEFGKGDCLRASVCSILERDIADVPNFAECGYMKGIREWLAPQSMALIEINMIPREITEVEGHKLAEPVTFSHKNLYFDFHNVPFLVFGQSPRNRPDGRPMQHAVVGESDGYGIRIIHDPHPSRAGLLVIFGFAFIVGSLA